MYVATEEVLHKLLNNTLKLNTAYVQAQRAYKKGYYTQHKIIRTAIKQYNAINKLQNLQL